MQINDKDVLPVQSRIALVIAHVQYLHLEIDSRAEKRATYILHVKMD